MNFLNVSFKAQNVQLSFNVCKRLLAVIGLVIATSVSAQNLPELKVGIDPAFEPYGIKLPDGSLSGFDVDYANAICAEIKRKCVFVEQAWGGIIPALSAKKFDVIISSMSITEARKKVVLFTDKYSAAINRMVAKKGGTIDASAASLVGRKIGVAKGSTQETFAKKVYEKSGATVVSYANAAESYLDLAAGRVDAVIASALNVKKGLLDKPEGKDFGYVGPTLNDPEIFGVGAGMALRMEDTQLRDQLNAAIKATRQNGAYKKVNDKYFEFDTYGL